MRPVSFFNGHTRSPVVFWTLLLLAGGFVLASALSSGVSRASSLTDPLSTTTTTTSTTTGTVTDTTAVLDPLLDPANISTAAAADDWLTQIEEAQSGGGASTTPDTITNESVKRIRRLERVMELRWQQLDAACDPAAAFALTYLVTSYGVGDYIEAGFFDDGNFVSVIMVGFAARYFDAYYTWISGDTAGTSKPWLEAFQDAKAGKTTVSDDVFLGMNAHINYDLSMIMAAVGLIDANGNSRKPDHDRINHVLADVMDDVGYALAKYYDPSMAPGGTNDLTNPAVLELIYGWRENAWQNAVMLTQMPDAQSRATYAGTLEDEAQVIAKGLVTPKLESTAPGRVAFCQANP